MPSALLKGSLKGRRPRGFTIIEAVMVLIIVAVVVSWLTPSLARQLTHSRINRAASVCAADFYLAQSLAARNRQPVRVVFDSTAKTATLKLPNDSTLLVRYYGLTSGYKLPTFYASPTVIQVLPSGMANTTITVNMSDGVFLRQVRMSQAGQIRILRS
jgi:prepilin-type N-terminal cleavage/methylation domain-containing protein